MMKKSRLVLAGSLLLAAAPCRAGGAAGAEPFNFLFLDANARAVALSGAYTALAYDANALLYNPAGLGRIAQHEATFMHNQYLSSITQDYLAFAATQGFGLNLNYVNSGSVARTTVSNKDGTALGYTGLSDVAFGAGYGRSFGDIALGVGAKFINETISGISGRSYAFDLGALYSASFLRGFTTGLAFQNMGRPVKFKLGGEEMPLNFRWGAAYAFDAFGNQNAVSMDITKERNESVLVGIGVETIVLKTMALRLGFNNRNTVGTGITGGIGWLYKDFSLDYALATYGALGLTHRISATVRWGAKPEAGPAAPSKQMPRRRLEEVDRLIAAKDLDAARVELIGAGEAIGENDPLRVRFWERMGTIAWHQKDEAGAKSAYLASIILAEKLGLREPELAETYAKLALCWMAEKNLPEAATALNVGLQKNPSQSTLRFIEEQLKKIGEPQ